MQNQISQFAASFGLDASAVSSLAGFLIHNITKNEAGRAAFSANPDRFIAAGVEAWHKQSTEAFTELLENTTERAHAWHRQIASDVWTQARAKGGAA